MQLFQEAFQDTGACLSAHSASCQGSVREDCLDQHSLCSVLKGHHWHGCDWDAARGRLRGEDAEKTLALALALALAGRRRLALAGRRRLATGVWPLRPENQRRVDMVDELVTIVVSPLQEGPRKPAIHAPLALAMAFGIIAFLAGRRSFGLAGRPSVGLDIRRTLSLAGRRTFTLVAVIRGPSPVPARYAARRAIL